MNPSSNIPSNEFPIENHFFNLSGWIQTFTEEPTYTPKNISQQLVLVTAGGSTAMYCYDTNATTWLKVTLS